jgi:hypothetical protein
MSEETSFLQTAEQHLARQRPINELIGVAVNATAWVGLSVFLIVTIWHDNAPHDPNRDGFVFQLFQYAVTVVAAGTSGLAAYGLFMPVYRIAKSLQRLPGLAGVFVAWLGLWLVNISILVWLLAVAFTFIGLASTLYPQ